MTSTWTLGEHHGVVWPSGIALLDARVEAATVNLLWERAAGAGPAGVEQLGDFLTLLAEVVGNGLLGLPDFAVAVSSGPAAGTLGADAQLAARGRFRVHARAQGEQVEVSGEGVTTWAEKRVRRATGVVLSVAGPGAGPAGVREERNAVGLVLASGVVPAGTIALGAVDASGAGPVGLTAGSGALGSGATGGGPLGVGRPGAGRPGSALDPQPPVRPDFISEVPGFVRTAPSTPPPPPSDPAAAHPAAAHSPSLELETQWSGDHDGETIARPPGERATFGAEGSGAPAHPAPGPAASTPPGAGQLLAVLCSSGHANPPQRPTCRVCGVALGAAPTRVPRPALGTVIAVSGESLPLTGPVVIGRAPQAARFTGTEAPRLMKLVHPHLSSSHVALRIEDWNVLAVDLGSTNGTFLRRNGRPPYRLSDTSHLLVPGDVLDLGHGVHLRFEELP